jgi:hypothetical protein
VFYETPLLFKELNVNNDELYENILIKKMYEMAKIPKSDQSQNTSRKYKSEK